MTHKLKRPVAFLSALVMVLAIMLYFPSGMFSNISFGLKASAEEYDTNGFGDDGSYQDAKLTIGEYDIDGDGDKDGDDVAYAISNAGQLYWFANNVNNDNGTYESSNAVLTANITVNQNVLDANGELNEGTFKSWTPIGNYSNAYTCTFDGQGYTISGLYFDDANTDCVGLFGYVERYGNVFNIGVVDSYFKGDERVGGVCGLNEGTIKKCYNTGAVSGTTFVGGVCGSNDGTITNCYNTGPVFGGSVCGFNRETIINCYYDSDKDGGEAVEMDHGIVTDVEGRPTADFTDGTICELVGYHSHKINGFCGLCCGYELATETTDKYDIDGDTTKDTVYEISNAGQLYWFADKVSNDNTNYKNANAVLTADIVVNENVLVNGKLNSNLTNPREWTPIGNSSNKYTGTFDGHGYTVSGLYVNDSNTSYVGLFGSVGSGGKVSGVGIADSYFKGNDYVGGVCGENGGTITNCYYSGAVIAVNRKASVGGVCGYNEGAITNCYNSGNISAEGSLSLIGGVCADNEGTITNCYYLSDTADENGGKTETQFGSGEVAYLLSQGTDGSVWGQTIGTENYPVLGGKNVLGNIDKSAFANDIIVYGQSASLDGTIGFNIYVSADDAYNWSAKINNAEVTKPEKDANGLYKFTYQVAAKDMDESINFTVNDKIDVTVSVSGYLAALSETDNESLKNLVNSMSDYGNAAKSYFSKETVAEQTVTDDLSGYAFTVGTMPEGISYYGSSLILQSETTIRHYFTLAEGENIADFTFKVNNSAVTPTEKQGYYYIDIENVSAEKLGTEYTVNISGRDVITKYSALSYANKVLGSGAADDNLINLVKSLYLYNKNALAYNAA